MEHHASLSGWLFKRNKLLKRWRKSFFVFDARAMSLCYYPSEKASKKDEKVVFIGAKPASADGTGPTVCNGEDVRHEFTSLATLRAIVFATYLCDL
jgi:hypothetical protein